MSAMELFLLGDEEGNTPFSVTDFQSTLPKEGFDLMGAKTLIRNQKLFDFFLGDGPQESPSAPPLGGIIEFFHFYLYQFKVLIHIYIKILKIHK